MGSVVCKRRYGTLSKAVHRAVSLLSATWLALTSGFVFTATAQDVDVKLSQEKIEQLAAPVALYPDSLLSQVLMASTYPLEIVQAARWSDKNTKLKGAALEGAMQQQSWDASVKSLTAFPDVLKLMNEKLGWTQELGNAFLAQQKDVLAAVQTLRRRAKKAGNLKSTKQQKVSTSKSSGSKTYIVIEPARSSVVYVPVYNPTVVYGTWPYPAYPPYYYNPPGYAARGAFWFASGVAVGAALWGNCNWGRNQVNINVNRYNQFNRTNINTTNWKHNSVHRKGVPYANSKLAKQYGRTPRNARSREQFRGRANAGRNQLARPSNQAAARRAVDKRSASVASRSKTKSASSKANRKPRRQTSAARRTGGKSSRQQVSSRKSSSSRRPTSQRTSRHGRSNNRRSSAYSGAGSGQRARRQSSRGRSSRASHQGGSRARGGGGRARGGRRR